MTQRRTIPPSILCAIRLRCNLAYLSAQAMHRTKNLFERAAHEDVFKARVTAYLRAVSEGAAYDIERMKKGIV